MYRTEFDLNEVPADIRQYFEEVEVQCREPWMRVVERTVGRSHDCPKTALSAGARGGRGSTSTVGQSGGGRVDGISVTTGWRPGCSHGLDPVPAVVLDPFSGSGTTGLVALQLGRSFVGIELSEEYCRMAERRLAGTRAQGILALT